MADSTAALRRLSTSTNSHEGGPKSDDSAPTQRFAKHVPGGCARNATGSRLVS